MSKICSNCFQPLLEGEDTCPDCGYSLNKDQQKFPLALSAGTVLNGRYILGRVLGQGGFGITYVAQDHRTGTLVAVKEYFPDTIATRSQGNIVCAYTGQREENFTYGKECFLNEAKTLAEFIGNPNIVRVYSYFEENNTAYFVMEYVQGISFQDYLKDRGSISWQEAKRILVPVMEALAAVHGKGIVHRDVTPDNIYITTEGQVKLLDFGAARYSLGDKSRSLDVVLKHGFAPKEQYSRRGRQGPFTDVYALGATFYFAITGRIPPDSIDRQDQDDLILPSSLGIKIPLGVEDALCKALAVSAQDRFQSMGEFQLALRQGEEDEDTARLSVSSPVQSGLANGPGASPVLVQSNGTNDLESRPVVNSSGADSRVQPHAFPMEKRKKLLYGVGAVAAVVVVIAISVGVGSKLGRTPEKMTEYKPSVAVKTDPPTSEISPVPSEVIQPSAQVSASEPSASLLPMSPPPTQPTQFDSLEHGITGAKFAIDEIRAESGLIDQYDEDTCCCLVDEEGGPWFLALYQRKTWGQDIVAYYSLYNLRGNGLVVSACEELYLAAGGNNGAVGICRDAVGTLYLMVESRRANGQASYTSYTFTPMTEDGLAQRGSYFASVETNYDTGEEIFIVGDTKTDESGLQTLREKFAPICTMDLYGNYVGDVMSFESFMKHNP